MAFSIGFSSGVIRFRYSCIGISIAGENFVARIVTIPIFTIASIASIAPFDAMVFLPSRIFRSACEGLTPPKSSPWTTNPPVLNSRSAKSCTSFGYSDSSLCASIVSLSAFAAMVLIELPSLTETSSFP